MMGVNGSNVSYGQFWKAGSVKTLKCPHIHTYRRVLHLLFFFLMNNVFMFLIQNVKRLLFLSECNMLS